MVIRRPPLATAVVTLCDSEFVPRLADYLLHRKVTHCLSGLVSSLKMMSPLSIVFCGTKI